MADQDQIIDASRIADILKSSRYDAEILPVMEKYVAQQCSQQNYDFEANLAILKLYQFFPQCVKIDTLTLILIKALMNLPYTDFMSSLYLVSEECANVQPVSTIVDLGTMLETGKFKSFWAEYKNQKNIFAHVPGFERAMRSYMVTVLAMTYQKIQKALLMEYLDVDQDTLANIITTEGWRSEGTCAVFPLNEDNQAKVKKTHETLQYNQMAKLLTTLGKYQMSNNV